MTAGTHIRWTVPVVVETIGAWLLAILWVSPLLYALWAAFHGGASRSLSRPKRASRINAVASFLTRLSSFAAACTTRPP